MLRGLCIVGCCDVEVTGESDDVARGGTEEDGMWLRVLCEEIGMIVYEAMIVCRVK